MEDRAFLPSTLDPPFLAPIECSLDIPPPPSINQTRRIDRAGARKLDRWKVQAGKHIMAAGGLRKFAKMPAMFEVTLILDEEACGNDLDNSPKHAIDFARTLGLILNDDKRYMRRVTVEWGHAPAGCRLVLRSIS